VSLSLRRAVVCAAASIYDASGLRSPTVCVSLRAVVCAAASMFNALGLRSLTVCCVSLLSLRAVGQHLSA
jgi:hypothetical protein